MASPPWPGPPAIWVTPRALSLREDAPMPNRGNTSPGRAAHHLRSGVRQLSASDGIGDAGELFGHRPEPMLEIYVVRL